MAKFNDTHMLHTHMCALIQKTLPNVGEDVDQPNSHTDLVRTHEKKNISHFGKQHGRFL